MLLLNTRTNKVEHFDSAEAAPPYAAVSYVWPTPEKSSPAWSTAQLVVANSPSPAPFESPWPIPSCSPDALNKALTAIYTGAAAVLDSSDRADATCPAPSFTHIWMDVLCIPQNDDAHKAAEVDQMGSYYARAVCVWVFLDDLGEPSWPMRQGHKVARWFTRLWTLQECVLPHKIYFYIQLSPPKQPTPSVFDRAKALVSRSAAEANSRTDAAAAAATAELLRRGALPSAWVSRKHAIAHVWMASMLEINTPITAGESLKTGLQLLALSVPKPSVRMALLLASMRDCRFPVDRLYGILGILPRNETESFDFAKVKVDYKKPFDAVAAEFALAMGPAVVAQFASVSPAPPELQQDDFTATTTAMGWFGSFKPGAYINASIPSKIGPEGLKRVFSDNAYHHDFDLALTPTAPLDGALRPADVLPVTPSVSRDGVRIPSAVLVPVADFKPLRPNTASAPTPEIGLSLLIYLMAQTAAVGPALLAWAKAELLNYAERTSSHGFTQRLTARVSSAMLNLAPIFTNAIELPFVYPPFIKDVEIRTPAGRRLAGIADDGRVGRDAMGQQLVLVFVGFSMCSGSPGNVPPDQTEDYAVCKVVRKKGKDGEPMVLKKLGVFHRFPKRELAAAATAAAAAAATPTAVGEPVPPSREGVVGEAPICSDFERCDVLIQ
ncbi:hypothetical protein DFJ73DRAFT_832627 [Zopfochytrium polystomum]|nr:hypothetical protein DFJ73DRAFT_832627 [Zopfochytrium polystomum]